MRLPSPDDPADAPIWDNYVVAQVAQATLGLIPVHALAVGVRIDGPAITLVFQMSQLTDADHADVSDIADELQDLVGDQIEVLVEHVVRSARSIELSDRTRWVFLQRE